MVGRIALKQCEVPDRVEEVGRPVGVEKLGSYGDTAGIATRQLERHPSDDKCIRRRSSVFRPVVDRDAASTVRPPPVP